MCEIRESDTLSGAFEMVGGDAKRSMRQDGLLVVGGTMMLEG